MREELSKLDEGKILVIDLIDNIPLCTRQVVIKRTDEDDTRPYRVISLLTLGDGIDNSVIFESTLMQMCNIVSKINKRVLSISIHNDMRTLSKDVFDQMDFITRVIDQDKWFV